MAVNMTIIGLGQIGTSIGLALASQGELVKRVGHDKDPHLMKQAEKLGAVDKSVSNLPASVRDADLVILSLPVDQVRETMAIIAPDLRDSAVVMDTAPVKEVVAAWAKELLPPGRFYVGLTPVLNPAYLQEHESGQEAAHADLFKGGLMAIVVPPSTASEAIKLAADLARLLGCAPLFADPLEVDSLMAATHILPQLMSAALLNITVDQPGWREGRKLAGRAYAEVTGPVVLLGEPEALASSALLSQEHAVRLIDGLIAS
ncbi:MAG TPA: prephenate dehydrogenase/arogenate dehydrogenase family protein, partial [Anaerolineales bacterium]